MLFSLTELVSDLSIQAYSGLIRETIATIAPLTTVSIPSDHLMRMSACDMNSLCQGANYRGAMNGVSHCGTLFKEINHTLNHNTLSL